MSFFKGVGDFFVKEIPHFVTKTVPSAFKPETYAPDLVPLRQTVADLKVSVPKDRDRFFTEQAKLSQARARYVELSDMFTQLGRDAIELDVSKADRLAKELSSADKTVKNVVKVTRTVTGIATLGLAELAFVHADVADEREALNREKAILSGTSKRLKVATTQVVKARRAVEAEITTIQAQLAKAGIEEGPSAASELTARAGEREARIQTAAQLLVVGTDLATVMSFTGLSEDELKTLAPQSGDAPETDDDSATELEELLTDEERELLSDNA